MTEDLTITQKQLAKALYDQGVVTPSGRTIEQIAAGIWYTLRKAETEDLLAAARDAYAKKMWQRAADHYAALDSQLGQSAPLPGIWNNAARPDPYEELVLQLGIPAGKAPRVHPWDDLTGRTALAHHLAKFHHIEDEGRSATGLRAVHNGLHGVDDAGRMLGVAAPGPHAFTEYKDDPLGDATRFHLENVHEIAGHGLSPAKLRLTHLHAHESADRVTEATSHEH